MGYSVRATGDEIFKTSALVVPTTIELASSPAEVWEALGSDEMWSWFPPLDRLRWLSGRPLGEGAVRTIRVARLFTLEEHFYRWEEGRRATFHVVGVTRPVLNALAEDFVLEPTASGGTRLTWTFALDPKLSGARVVGKLLGPLLKAGNGFAIGGIRKILPRG